MAHIYEIEDKKGDVINRKIYCSDLCHVLDNDNYKGWNGCNEISFSQPCERKGCSNIVKGIEDFED